MSIRPTTRQDPDRLDLKSLKQFLSVVIGSDGKEHAVLSDGARHIRLDIDDGTIGEHYPVRVCFSFDGIGRAEAALMALRRFLHLHRRHVFSKSLFPRDPAIVKGIMLLRVSDALAEGASHRELAEILYGHRRLADWHGSSGSLRSRVRRLAKEARKTAGGGYRSLLLRDRLK